MKLFLFRKANPPQIFVSARLLLQNKETAPSGAITKKENFMNRGFSSIMNNYIPHRVDAGFRGKNVGGAERVLSGLLGAYLLRRGMRSTGMLGKLAMMLPAAAVLKRAMTGNCELYRAMGMSSMRDRESHSQAKIESHPQVDRSVGSYSESGAFSTASNL